MWRGGFRTKREAQDALHQVVERLRRGEYVEPSKLTLGAFLEEAWLPAMRTQLRPATWESYDRNIRVHVNPAIGDIPLQRLTAVDLDRLYAQLLAAGRRDGRPLSARSVRYVHTIIHGALAYAGRKNLVTRNVADLADPPKAKPAAPADRRVWTPGELRRFLDHVAQDRLYTLWLLLAITGMRRGEALGLTWPDVDLDAGQLAIRRTLVQVGYRLEWSTPKTRYGRRTLSIDPGTVAALREHRARQAKERLVLGPAYADHELVFCREDGLPIHPERVTKVFQTHVRATRLPKIRLHDLRHGWASHAVAAGIDVRTISSRLGHADAGFTMRVYAHQVPEAEARAATRVAELLLRS
jgi:integrase